MAMLMGVIAYVTIGIFFTEWARRLGGSVAQSMFAGFIWPLSAAAMFVLGMVVVLEAMLEE